MLGSHSTRGLDASTALDYAKSIRILTDVFRNTSFVSLYQAGEGIYQQFDKVLVIDEGRQVYFGPAKEARQYMVGLGFSDRPRQTTADYLTGCTDPNERRVQFACLSFLWGEADPFGYLTVNSKRVGPKPMYPAMPSSSPRCIASRRPISG